MHPVDRLGPVCGVQGELQRRPPPLGYVLQGGAAIAPSRPGDVLASCLQHIEHDQRGRLHPCQIRGTPNPGGHPLLQRVEAEPAGNERHQLAIQHRPVRHLDRSRTGDVGKQASQVCAATRP
nr:hypothetical protein [Microlunatus sp. Gsoil 973]